jgi:hypothetical protein
MSVTNIRSAAPISCDDDQLLYQLSQVLGGELIDRCNGIYDFEPTPGQAESGAGAVYRIGYTGRRFTSLQALSSVIIDILMEQAEILRFKLQSARFDGFWLALIDTLGLSGLTLNVCQRLRLARMDVNGIVLHLPDPGIPVLFSEQAQQRVRDAIMRRLPECPSVEFTFAVPLSTKRLH